jgi:hypothetical protein
MEGDTVALEIYLNTLREHNPCSFFNSSKEFGKIGATKVISNDALQVKRRGILLLLSRLLLSRMQ